MARKLVIGEGDFDPKMMKNKEVLLGIISGERHSLRVEMARDEREAAILRSQLREIESRGEKNRDRLRQLDDAEGMVNSW